MFVGVLVAFLHVVAVAKASLNLSDYKASVKVSSGATYQYIHIPRDRGCTKPYLLFLHGFPSLAVEWHHQINYFARLGYGIIAPDLLGYGGTDKPVELEAYKFRKMSKEVIDILDHEKIDSAVGIAHDFGSTLMSRTAVYHPERFDSFVFIALGYTRPGQKFTVRKFNRQSRKQLGYAQYGYIKFYDKPASSAIVDRHKASFFSLYYAGNATEWRYHLGPLGALETWLKTNQTANFGPWYSQEDQDTHDAAFSAPASYDAPLRWYETLLTNINIPYESTLPQESLQIKQPVLLLTGGLDPIGIPSQQVAATQPYVQDLTVQELQTTHWIHLQRPQRVNKAIFDFPNR